MAKKTEKMALKQVVYVKDVCKLMTSLSKQDYTLFLNALNFYYLNPNT